MPSPLVLSIVIVSYNTADLLRACLASLPAAVGAHDREVIVVDNDSSDGSPSMVAREFPAVTLIRQRENAGFAAANNVGLVRAKGDYLVLLNPDTLPAPGSLAALADFLGSRPESAVAAPRLLNADGSVQSAGYRFPGPWQALLDWFPLHHRLLASRLNGRYPPRREPYPIDHPLGACFVVRREAAAAVGLFDAGYFMYCEEVDWCHRLAAAGWQAWCLPSVTVVHYGGASTGQQPAEMFEELQRSRDRYFRRWLSPVQYRVTRLITMLGALAEAFRTHRRRRAGQIEARAADARIRACGRVFRGWKAHAPERIARLPKRAAP